MSKYRGEKVLVVPRAAFDQVGYVQGTALNAQNYLDAFMLPGVAFYMDRAEAEADPTHKQIIPYSIFVHQGKILHYTRGGAGGESRLHDKGSIGIGGHINPIDGQVETDGINAYLCGVEREIQEELNINGTFQQQVLGIINDDTNEVGAVHLGVIHLFELSTDDVTSNEDALAQLRFVSLDELEGDLYDRLETWSQLALSLYKESL